MGSRHRQGLSGLSRRTRKKEANMKQEVLSKAAADFAAVDVSDENAQIAEIEAEIARAHEAIQAAETRCSEIARAKDDIRNPRGSDVASALLAGESATDAARAGPSVQALEDERLSLRDGIKALNRQVEDWRAEITNIESNARSKISQISQSFHDALMADAREKLTEAAEIYAAAAAVSATTRYGTYETSQFRDIMDVASRSGALLYGLRQIDVPTEINDVLRNLEGKGRAMRVGLITRATI